MVIELRVDFKSNSHCALVRFWNHAYDFRPNCTPLSSITIIYYEQNSCAMPQKSLLQGHWMHSFSLCVMQHTKPFIKKSTYWDYYRYIPYQGHTCDIHDHFTDIHHHSHEIEAMVQIPHPLHMGIKFPIPWKTLIIKFPPPQDGKCVMPGGGGMLKLRFDRYLNIKK